jgi:hypothetical protein
MEMKGWGFIRHTKFAELRAISTTLGLKPLTRVHSMYSAIGEYMNKHAGEAAKFS